MFFGLGRAKIIFTVTIKTGSLTLLLLWHELEVTYIFVNNVRQKKPKYWDISCTAATLNCLFWVHVWQCIWHHSCKHNLTLILKTMSAKSCLLITDQGQEREITDIVLPLSQYTINPRRQPVIGITGPGEDIGFQDSPASTWSPHPQLIYCSLCTYINQVVNFYS